MVLLPAAILTMDANDTPRLSWYGRGHERTPMYRTLVEDMHFEDVLGEDYGPTSVTLNRKYRLDYIAVKTPKGGKVEACYEPSRRVKLVGLQEGKKVLVDEGDGHGTQPPIYGPPLPAIGHQGPMPSDHMPIAATLQITYHPGTSR